jgi:hypothetical protein
VQYYSDRQTPAFLQEFHLIIPGKSKNAQSQAKKFETNMALTQKEIAEEIEKLASFLDRQVSQSKQFYNRIAPHLNESGKNISKVIDICKPLVKKRSREFRILLLKAQLKLVNEMIEARKRKIVGEDQTEGKKKGG